jgi:K+-sensing histidine kinase KdpD
MNKRRCTKINRLNLIITDLLEVGQLEEKKFPLRRKDFAFHDMVAETVAEIKAQPTRTRLSLKATRKLPATVTGTDGPDAGKPAHQSDQVLAR